MRKLHVPLAVCAAIVLNVLMAACAHHSEQSAAAQSVGFQFASAPDADAPPLALAIWYPSDAPAQPTQIALERLNVAMDGAPHGNGLPLVVMSHGTGGSMYNSSTVALSLAEAGFAVVAVTHTGDNYQDRSNSFSRRNFADRPRQITRVIDFMLNEWTGRGVIDAARIGVFGHSAGGATSLIAVGGAFDYGRVTGYCQSAAGAEDWGCRNARERGVRLPSADASAGPILARDTRIRAAVVAAPALSLAFQPGGLADVSAPVQVWVAGGDAIVPDAALLEPLLTQRLDYHLVPNAGHFSFLSPCSEVMAARAPEICVDPPGFDRAAFQREFVPEVVRFFEANLAP